MRQLESKVIAKKSKKLSLNQKIQKLAPKLLNQFYLKNP